MKILIISDTHGRIGNPVHVYQTIKGIDRVIHLGDLTSDAEDIESVCQVPVDSVAGNCDYLSRMPREKVIEFYGTRILLCHGHQYHVKSGVHRLLQEGKKRKADIVLFGHTHVSYHKKMGNITLFNPGSLSSPRDGKPPSYGILELLGNGKFQFQTKKLKKSIDLW